MRKVLEPMTFWQNDLCSCLQSCVATLLAHHGHEPSTVLGAVWDMYYVPGDFRHEEYYYPCRWPGLVESLAPYHPLGSHWRAPADAEEGWAQVRASVAEGVPAVVAVDNYDLPFRPAFQDIHAGHLVIVYGFDDAEEEAYVIDSMPPAYKGPIALRQLAAARGSPNPEDSEDAFFSSAPVGQRWFALEINGALPALDRAFVRASLSANLERFRAPTPEGVFSGMEGFDAYLRRLVAGAGAGDATVLQELYVLGWALQAATALHGEFLAVAGRRLDWLRLTELGREVDRVSHYWSALRMTGAHALADPVAAAPRLERMGARMQAEQRAVLDEMDLLLRHG